VWRSGVHVYRGHPQPQLAAGCLAAGSLPGGWQGQEAHLGQYFLPAHGGDRGAPSVAQGGGVAVPSAEEVFTVERSLPHGHVAATLGSARACGAEDWFDGAPSPLRKPRSSSPLGPPRFRKKPSRCSASPSRVPSHNPAAKKHPHEHQEILTAVRPKFGLGDGCGRQQKATDFRWLFRLRQDGCEIPPPT